MVTNPPKKYSPLWLNIFCTFIPAFFNWRISRSATTFCYPTSTDYSATFRTRTPPSLANYCDIIYFQIRIYIINPEPLFAWQLVFTSPFQEVHNCLKHPRPQPGKHSLLSLDNLSGCLSCVVQSLLLSICNNSMFTHSSLFTSKSQECCSKYLESDSDPHPRGSLSKHLQTNSYTDALFAISDLNTPTITRLGTSHVIKLVNCCCFAADQFISCFCGFSENLIAV